MKAIAWDPKSPAALLCPATADAGSDGVDGGQTKDGDMVINYSLCDRGSGCNTFESSAIMNLLDARDAYLDETTTGSTNSFHHHQCLRRLSREYRRALANCIDVWSEDNENCKEESEKEQQQEQDELVDLPLLKATYAITHLSEIFLLLPSSQKQQNEMNYNIGYGFENDVWNLPGAVTADTVRYLRKHHFGDIGNLFDPSVVENIYQLYQPDLGNSEYWELVQLYMVWGCLEDAWALLSHHSIVRRIAQMEEEEQMLQERYNGSTNNSDLNAHQAASLAEDREGFLALRSILLSAPLPGARNNASDEGFNDSENEHDETKKYDIGNDTSDNDNSEIEEEYIEGLPTSAYRLWETSGEKGNATSTTGDYYVNFEPNAAYQVHHYWKQAISGLSPLQRLRRRIPQLNKLLSLLEGHFRDIEFHSWHEELCAELLYKNPNIRLMDMNIRAGALVQKYSHGNNYNTSDGKNENIGIDEMMLNIMRGNAGQVVQALHEFGGGSGAALPAVTTSLLSQLLEDANLLKNPSETYNLNTELLIEASSAIRSSLANEGYNDLGTRLAVRLLLPHIEIDSDIRITATLANTLEHHSPKSDAEAKSLLALCHKLIERKNVRVLDGCCSICLARYHHYIGKRIPGGAVYWLLSGMTLESLVFCDGSKRSGDWQRALASGVCYRRLVVDFVEISRSLLKGLLGEEKGTTLFYARAKEMVAATKEESPNCNNLISFVPAVKLIENIIIIAEGIAERKDNSIVANSIISCLEERPNDEDDGVVSSLARSLNWDLMRLSIEILEIDAKRAETQEYKNENKDRPMSSFDVRGMGVLLSVFTIETKAQALKKQDTGTADVEERENKLEEEKEHLQRARLILGKGLQRAFATENSMKRTVTSSTSVQTAIISKLSREEQERAVQIMLDY